MAPPRRRRKRNGGGNGGGGGGGLLGGNNALIAVAVASTVIGLAEQAGLLAKLPAVPLVGRKGLLAIGAWYYSKHGGGSLARDIAIAAAALSGYELGTKGAISGNDDE
jgi:hypothetical protein